MLKFRSIGHLNNHDKVVLAGAVAMAGGTFLPIVRIPVLGTINYFARAQGDGTIILVLSAIVIACVFSSYRRIAALIGVVSLLVMAMTLLQFLDALHTFHKELAGNPFGALVANSIGIEWGWLPLIGGALAVIGAGAMPGNTYDNKPLFSRPDQEIDDDGLEQEIDQRIAQRIQEAAQRSPTSESPAHSASPAAFGRRFAAAKYPTEANHQKRSSMSSEIPSAIAYPIVGAMLLVGGFFIVLELPARVPAAQRAPATHLQSQLQPSRTKQSVALSPQILLDVRGSGTKSTEKFTTQGNDWDVSYDYDCSNFGMRGNFQFYIQAGNGSPMPLPGANELGMSGSDIDHYHRGGTFFLEVNSECDWHVVVKG